MKIEHTLITEPEENCCLKIEFKGKESTFVVNIWDPNNFYGTEYASHLDNQWQLLCDAIQNNTDFRLDLDQKLMIHCTGPQIQLSAFTSSYYNMTDLILNLDTYHKTQLLTTFKYLIDHLHLFPKLGH
jgi:hypothetical protein